MWTSPNKKNPCGESRSSHTGRPARPGCHLSISTYVYVVYIYLCTYIYIHMYVYGRSVGWAVGPAVGWAVGQAGGRAVGWQRGRCSDDAALIIICTGCSCCGPGPYGRPWSLVGLALVGLPWPLPARPVWAGPLWATRALMGRALMGPLGPHGPGANGVPLGL